MAQIKVLKIGSDGYTIEHDSVNDDLTVNSLTSGSLTIDSDLVLNSSGITVPTGKDIVITDSPTQGTHAVNRDYVQTYVQGLDPQQSVLRFEANAPALPASGERYIIDAARSDAIVGINTGSQIFTIAGDQTSNYAIGDVIKVKGGAAGNLGYYTVTNVAFNSPNTDITVSESISSSTVSGSIYLAGTTWRTVGVDIIAEYNGSIWVYTTPNAGFNTYVENLDTSYVYNTSLEWVTLSSAQSHNNLSGLQGGSVGEYYHISNSEHTYLQNLISKIADYNNFVDKSVSESITGTWTFSRAVLTEARLPTSAPGTPVAGDVYTSSGIIYVYDGSGWVEQGSSGDPVISDYTLDSGLGSATYFGQAVRIIGTNNEVTPAQANSFANTRGTIGILITTGSIAGGTAVKVQENGVIAGVLSGATAGTPYFLDGTTAGALTTTPPATGTVLLIGYAKNATDLQIKVEVIRVRAT